MKAEIPDNLAELTKLTEDQARCYLEGVLWPNGAVCPHCGSQDAVRLAGKSTRPGLLKCRACRKQFTVTVGTIFHDSHISIRQWLIAFHLMCSSKKGVSAKQLQRNLGLKSYQSAWHLAHRIRLAMKRNGVAALLKGAVEVDETYIGGKSREGIRGRGSERKTPVLALVERQGNIRVRSVSNVSGQTLKGAIRECVDKDATILTDELPSYRGIGKEFAGGHKVVKHGTGDASTNTAESFFALLKRGVHGTFHHVSRRHLHRYCDEFGFRWDARKVTDGERTLLALQQSNGKRLLYKQAAAMAGQPEHYKRRARRNPGH
jgi:transposase-like protein